jgi:hypothetical protein
MHRIMSSSEFKQGNYYLNNNNVYEITHIVDQYYRTIEFEATVNGHEKYRYVCLEDHRLGFDMHFYSLTDNELALLTL